MNTHVSSAQLPPRRTVHVVGRHRVRFLNAMTSMGLMKTGAGDARFATMSTAAGKHLGQMRIEIGADDLTLDLPDSSAERLLEGLRKHRVADDIRWTSAEQPAEVRAVIGDDAATLATWLGGVLGPEATIAPGRWADVAWQDGVVRVSAFDGQFTETARPTTYLRPSLTVAASLDAALQAAGASPIDPETLACQYILALWPDDARDLPDDEPTLASTRLVLAVDWNKGCFLGQEVFVMARDRGEAPKKLVALRVEGTAPATGSDILTASGQIAGRVGSTASEGATSVLLGLLKRRFAADPGLVLSDGRALTQTHQAG
jgi:folate-binding Fe-S cluster repair protein YgfZ